MGKLEGSENFGAGYGILSLTVWQQKRLEFLNRFNEV